MTQELDDPRNIIRHRTSPQRTHLRDARLDLLHRRILVRARAVMPRVVVEHVGLDAAGGDGVDGDALGAGVGGERPREALDGGFGAGVECVVLDAGHVGGHGGHEDDASALCGGEVSRKEGGKQGGEWTGGVDGVEIR